jgi:hypothetical protein
LEKWKSFFSEKANAPCQKLLSLRVSWIKISLGHRNCGSHPTMLISYNFLHPIVALDTRSKPVTYIPLWLKFIQMPRQFSTHTIFHLKSNTKFN